MVIITHPIPAFRSDSRTVPSELHTGQNAEEPHSAQLSTSEALESSVSNAATTSASHIDHELDISDAHHAHSPGQQLLPTMIEPDSGIQLQNLSTYESRSLISSDVNSGIEDEKSQNAFWRPQPTMWDPFWLRKSVLIAFAIVFAAMSVAVVLLYHFSKSNNGLATQEQSRHYAWTYGPTARE